MTDPSPVLTDGTLMPFPDSSLLQPVLLPPNSMEVATRPLAFEKKVI